MAEAWLEEIYAHSRYVTKLKKIRDLCRLNDTYECLRHWEDSCSHLAEVSQCPLADEKVQAWIQRIEHATRKIYECSRVLDLIQLEVLPMMYHLISLYGKIDVSEGGYRMQSSKAGYLTLFDEENGRYLHSIVDPMEQAHDMAKKVYSPKNTEYHIWGAGLGYLAYQIYQISYGSAKIHVYEADRTLLEYGRHYGVLDWISEEKLVLHLDLGAEEFLKNAEKEKGNFIISHSNPNYLDLTASIA